MSLISSDEAIPPFAAEILEAFAQAVRPDVILCLESAFCSALLVPLLFSLLYLPSHRSWIWYMVLADILFGIGLGAWGIYETSKALFNPVNAGFTTSTAAYGTIMIMSAWLVDIVLFFRLIAVYPYRRGQAKRFLRIIAFPVVVKIVRLVAVAMISQESIHAAFQASATEATATSSTSARGWSNWPKVEWSLQIVDNGYASLLFMWKLRSGFRGSDVGRVSTGTRPDSLGARLRTLFWIAASNFVFPVVFNIIQLIVLVTCEYYTVTFVELVNVYVSIVGIVFATVWSSTQSLRATATPPSFKSNSRQGPGPLVFRRDDQVNLDDTKGSGMTEDLELDASTPKPTEGSHVASRPECPLSIKVDTITDKV